MGNGFGSGKFGLTVLRARGGMPEGWQEKMAALALPVIGELVEEVHGWTGWRHVLDRDFTDDGLLRGGIPTGLLVKAQRKVPPTTLAAEVAQEERAVMAAEEKSYLNMQCRMEIKKSVRERLLPDMPVTYQGVEWFCASELVYCTATTEASRDSFVLAWMQALDQSLVPLDAVGLAMANGADVRDWPPVAFGQQGELFCRSAGNEFLLWLWHSMETCGGMVNVPGQGEFAYMIDGPLVLSADSKRVTIKSDKATIDSETSAALMDGLIPHKYRLTVVRGAEVWQCTIDSGLVVRGLSLPTTENFESIGKFQERAVFIGVFWVVLTALYGSYCADRGLAGGWKEHVRKINAWIEVKAMRHGNGLGSDKSLNRNLAEAKPAADVTTKVTISMTTPDGKEEVVLGEGKTVAAAGKAMRHAAKELIAENQRKLAGAGERRQA